MNQIKRELNRFLFAGLSAVFSDLLIYYILLNFLNSDAAKGISFLVGTVVAFILNKYWTFEKPKKSFKELVQFALLYSSTLGLNVITNKIMLSYTSIVFLSFFTATGVSTVLNFIGQKYWVFKN